MIAAVNVTKADNTEKVKLRKSVCLKKTFKKHVTAM